MAESMIYGSGRAKKGDGSKVSKYGDSMLGYLDFTQQFEDGEIPSSNTWGLAAPRFFSSDGNNLGYLAPYFRTNGRQELILQSRRIINGTNYYNYFGLGVDSSGNPLYDISNPAALRTALGLSYAVNDTFSASVYVATGYVTNSTKDIYIPIVLPKSAENINTVTVTAMVGALRGASGYVDGTSSTSDLYSAYTVNAAKVSDNYLYIRLTKASAYSNVTNNTPVSFSGSFTLKFT